MNYLDWLLMVIYILGLIWLSFKIGKTQVNKEDYYLGSKKIHWFPVGISTMATQLSTNSMLGAPAFVAFSIGGGLLWLQYELAVPLAPLQTGIWRAGQSRRDDHARRNPALHRWDAGKTCVHGIG